MKTLIAFSATASSAASTITPRAWPAASIMCVAVLSCSAHLRTNRSSMGPISNASYSIRKARLADASFPQGRREAPLFLPATTSPSRASVGWPSSTANLPLTNTWWIPLGRSLG